MKKIMTILLLAASFGFAASASDKPSFPGGAEALGKYISENLEYPAAAKANGVEGVVDVGFMVNPDGSISAVKVIRLVDPDLEQEAVRLVKGMPAWTPADKDGTPIAAPAKVSVPFILEQ